MPDHDDKLYEEEEEEEREEEEDEEKKEKKNVETEEDEDKKKDENDEIHDDDDNELMDYSESNAESEDEDDEDDDEDDEDDDDDANEELTKTLLKQLLTINKMKKKENEKKQKSFLPCVKNFLLKCNFEEKCKKIKNDNILQKLLELAKGIVKRKIRVANLERSDVRILKYITHKETPSLDKRVILAEDHRLHAVLRDGLKIIENEKKQQQHGRVRK